MKKILAALVMTGSLTLVGQVATPTTMNFADKVVKSKPDVTYGRVKEMTAGDKVVIDVDNAVDKTFKLNDPDVAVKVASGLKVGDPVKITEHSVAGKTKSVAITRHSGGGVKHGDKPTAAAEKKAAK